MKKSVITVIVCLAFTLFTGCQKQSLAPLPSNPIVFKSGTYVNPADNQDEYMLISYNGRDYVTFGTLKTTIRANDISQCLGYVDGYTSCHVCTLTADPNANFIGIIDEESFMDQPMFYRAIDTAGQQIMVPTYIDDLGYNIW